MSTSEISRRRSRPYVSACGLLALMVSAGAGCQASNQVAADVGGSGGDGGSAVDALVAPEDSGAGETEASETGDTDTAAGGSVAAAIADYQTWQRRTDQPVPLAEDIFALCRSPSLAERQFLDSEHGMNRRMVLDWLNPGALAAYENKGTLPFPVGAAIVKEKLLRDNTGTVAVIARGVMIKRDPGFDAAHGDWEFAYWEPTAGLRAGPTESKHCGDCHAAAQPTDFVFFDQEWRRP